MHNNSFEPTGQSAAAQLHKTKLFWQILKISGCSGTLRKRFQGSGDPGERLITLNVNEQRRRVDVMKQETLAWTLRYKLGLTGTKLGCDRAECGACTVLLDDVPHYSCSVLTHTVRDRKVLTIEGLASQDGTMHPYLFSDMTWGLMYVLHGLAGVGLIALVTVHVYFAVRPEKLDITKSMIFGSMRREFYLTHYDPQRWIVEVPSTGSRRTDKEA